jgi:hypothetical protein
MLSGAIPMIRTLSSAEALAELPPHGEARTVTSWLTGCDDGFLGLGSDRTAAQVRSEPFTLDPSHIDRVYCRSVDHARWAEQYSEDVIIITSR